MQCAYVCASISCIKEFFHNLPKYFLHMSQFHWHHTSKESLAIVLHDKNRPTLHHVIERYCLFQQNDCFQSVYDRVTEINLLSTLHIWYSFWCFFLFLLCVIIWGPMWASFSLVHFFSKTYNHFFPSLHHLKPKPVVEALNQAWFIWLYSLVYEFSPWINFGKSKHPQFFPFPPSLLKQFSLTRHLFIGTHSLLLCNVPSLSLH